MPRHLFIVCRKYPSLHDYLWRHFTDVPDVEVVLDRRHEQRRRAEIGPGGQERRRADRRTRGSIDEALRTDFHVFLTLS